MPDPQVKNGAMVGFKVGTQARVDEIITAGQGAIHGTFYLAKDTHRLYIGNEDTSLSPVNEGIITVAGVSSLPTVTSANRAAVAGNFYYASSDNILCIYNGTEWVQINPVEDTMIDTFTNSVSSGTVTYTINEKVVDSAHPTGSSLNNNKSASFTIAGSNGNTISTSGTTITVVGDEYDLASSVSNGNATISLGSTQSHNSSVQINAGDNISISKSGNNPIVIAATDTTLATTANGGVTVTNAANNGNGFVIAVKDTAGTNPNATLNPVIAYGDTGSSTANFVNGTATLNVYSKSDIDTKLTALDAMHYRGTIGTGGSASTDTTITSSTFNLTPPLNVGDTFKLSSDVSVDGHTYKANTILIANGTEYKYLTGNAPAGASADEITSNASLIGTINQSTLSFDAISATADTDTTYNFKAKYDSTNNKAGIVLHSSTGTETSKIDIAGGTAITVTGLNDNSVAQTVTVAHADVTSTPTTGNAIVQTEVATGVSVGGSSATTFGVVTGVTVNTQGHVTGVETSQITLKDTNLNISAVNNSVSAASNRATIKTGLTATDGAGATKTAIATTGNSCGSFTIGSDTLTVTSSNNDVTMNLVWGSFD